ncbi:hypothetical protein CK203_085369 [Vitis vinifera]|uniref:Uncharacterized protein n=1 Tax=Vitis vinifera TaxID=29760 RepID=A0A438E474_VITVI|nr:hypothetical protein CK203_085369 [Vitis vinifera]
MIKTVWIENSPKRMLYYRTKRRLSGTPNLISTVQIEDQGVMKLSSKFQAPRHFSMPKFDMYDGSGDPFDHNMHFPQAIKGFRWPQPMRSDPKTISTPHEDALVLALTMGRTHGKAHHGRPRKLY